jgi:toxin ParE1/3/4
VPAAIIHPEALAELSCARDFYESRRRGLGFELIQAAERTVEWIERNPEVCAADEWGVRATKMGKYPYAVYFTSTSQEVNILAFAHQSREPYYWRTRLSDSA